MLEQLTKKLVLMKDSWRCVRRLWTVQLT